MADTDDRRDYFRIEDEVLLDYRPLPPETDLDQPPDADWSGADAFGLRNQLASISSRFRTPLTRLRCRQPEITEVLMALDQKIEAIATLLLAHQLSSSDRKPRKVSLSASGVAFHAEDPLNEGGGLELRMVLLPSFATVNARVCVERCSLRPDFRERQPYHIALTFRGMREEQRAAIVKHGLSRQAAMRRD